MTRAICCVAPAVGAALLTLLAGASADDLEAHRLARAAAACADLQKCGYLLDEDADRLVKSREKLRGLFPAESR